MLVTEWWFLHSALSLIDLYQCIKFHLIPLNSFRDMLRTYFPLQKLKKGSNSVNTLDRVRVIAFCNFLYSSLSVYEISLNYLQYFKRYAPDKSVTDGRTHKSIVFGCTLQSCTPEGHPL